MYKFVSKEEFYKNENHPKMQAWEIECAKKFEKCFPSGAHFDTATVDRFIWMLSCIRIIGS